MARSRGDKKKAAAALSKVLKSTFGDILTKQKADSDEELSLKIARDIMDDKQFAEYEMGIKRKKAARERGVRSYDYDY